jgi:hypothetical protein
VRDLYERSYVALTMDRYFPIGTPGEPWDDAHKRAWFESRTVERSYHEEVLTKIEALDGSFEIIQYGSLPHDPGRYPLMAVKAESDTANAPWALVTGGVHGYETSGVQGAMAFLHTHASAYRYRVNLLVAPCVSPWGYEVINRWNPNCVDPNRSFFTNSPSEESVLLMKLIEEFDVDFLVHIDLHETTDSDNTEFRPAQAALNGLPHETGSIPDGFYTVGDSENPQPDFQAAIIAGVEAVTHIAPPDEAGQIIGSDLTQRGVINYSYAELGLCAGASGARFTTTTEVYPDSPTATPDICSEAQVAAVRAGLDFALA